jgi:hypothetical protein
MIFRAITVALCAAMLVFACALSEDNASTGEVGRPATAGE